jgi:hypothetical protein
MLPVNRELDVRNHAFFQPKIVPQILDIPATF